MSCLAVPAFIIAACLGGCQTSPRAMEPTSQEALSLLMPRSIEIVEPFTAWSDLDNSGGIDAIIVYVQPINASGDPIQAAGSMYVELYAFRQASGERKGKRLELWEMPLATQADQDTLWNRATQMYELKLILSPPTLAAKPGDKFVLMVSYNSPLGRRLATESVLQVPLGRDVLTNRR